MVQPQYAGPVNYQANLSIPVNATPGANQASAPLAALMQPTPFQVPPDIYEARNSLQDTNSTCLVGSAVLCSAHLSVSCPA